MRLKLILICLVCLEGALRNGNAEEARRWPLEFTAGRFEVHSDFRELDHAVLVDELQRLTDEMARLLELPPGKQPVHIVLFQSRSEYLRYMQTYFPDLPQRRALFIQHRGPGMLFTHWHAEVATDLRHEGAHALLNADSGPLPLWLDEGLAEYFEVRSGERFRGSHYLPEVSQLAKQGWVPPLESLEAITDFNQFQEIHYRDSWAWVHFLLHRRSETRELLIRAVGGDRRKALPLSRQVVQVLPAVELDFRLHFEELTL